MSLEHYFRDELAFLRLQGREFADAHPELTRFLSEQNTDPDVERLLEGFAFLTGNGPDPLAHDGPSDEELLAQQLLEEEALRLKGAN